MKMQDPSKTLLKVYAGTVATLLILLFSVVLSFRAFNELEDANWWNTHTYRVLVETDEMSTAIANMQSASRGYLLARDKDFLQLFYTGRASFNKHHENITRLTRDNPTQQKRLQLLKRQYEIWLNGNILPLIQMSPEKLKAEVNSAKVIQGLRKRRVMANSIRQTISHIEAMENDLLAQRMQRQHSKSNLTRTALLLNGGFAILLAGLFSSLLGR